MGEVTEWSIVRHWECRVRETGPWVRIPPSPLSHEPPRTLGAKRTSENRELGSDSRSGEVAVCPRRIAETLCRRNDFQFQEPVAGKANRMARVIYVNILESSLYLANATAPMW